MCASVCRKNAITMVESPEGFLYPYIDVDKCVECHECEKKCPAILCAVRNPESDFYMGWHKDKDVLLSSSSGGIFTAIADYIFDNGGVVFGVVRDPEINRVYHTYTECRDNLDPFRLSKYYQSEVGEIYKTIASFLKKGRLVLFTGSACQIAGLYSYLNNKRFENLITMDVLCHGVASKKVIDSYIESQEKRYHKKISNLFFRTKEEKNGWCRGGGAKMKLEFADGTSHLSEGPYDTYMLGFNNNFFLRESCYKCKYCGTERVADITVADYWRCNDNRIPEEQMRLGVSLILTNSVKGKEILSHIEKDCVIYSINQKDAIPGNRALSKPQIRPVVRDTFFQQMDKYGYRGAIERQFKKRFLKYNLKCFIRKVIPKRVVARILKNP